MTELQRKIKEFNLLLITEAMLPYLKEVAPLISKEYDILKTWKYVKFYQGEVYFYSEQYIDTKTLDELQHGFVEMIRGIGII